MWTADEMRRLEDLLAPTDVLVISDEVYEHMVFDGARHESAARFPGLAARSFIVSSFGKTYHVTGWKVGYVAAPAPLTAEFRKVHQFNVFTVNTPMQHALAAYMADPAPYLELPAFYQRKRDLFARRPARRRASSCCRAKAPTSSASTSPTVSDLREAEFCQWLTQRDRRRGDPAVGLLRQRLRPARGALLLRQEGRDAATRALERLARL